MSDKNDPMAYIYTDKDKVKLRLFTELLLLHQIEVYHNTSAVKSEGIHFEPGESFIVPLDQNQPVLARTMFEEVKSFKDSLFYDISGWTVAHGYGIDFKPWTALKNIGKKVEKSDLVYPQTRLKDAYAYVIPAGQYHLHKAVYQCQKMGIQVLYNQTEFTHNGMTIGAGSVIVPAQFPEADTKTIRDALQKLSDSLPLEIMEMTDGNGVSEVTLGHPMIKPVKQPHVGFFAGASVTPQNAGEVWHHFDIQLSIPATMLDVEKVSAATLHRYNTLIMPHGSYNSWSEKEAEIIKNWVRQGNTLLVFQEAGQWLLNKNIITLKHKKREPVGIEGHVNYALKSSVLGAQRLGGSVFKLEADLTHPLFYGVNSDHFYTVKRGTDLFETTSNATATPARYASDYLASGYVPAGIKNVIPQSAAITVHSLGAGRIIYFQDDLLFRGYWKNGEKVFNNALFWGIDIASHSASEE
jgi:hypothetical protein